MNRNIQKAMPIVLSIAGSIGVVATGVLVATEAEKANKNIREAKKQNDKKGVVKAFVKGYYPSLIVGGATIASIVAGTIISKRIEMSLTATTLMIQTAFQKYKGKVHEIFGDKADIIAESIMKDDYKKLDSEQKVIIDGEMLYYEEHIGFFKAKPSDLEAALGSINEHIQIIDGYASIRDFLKFCNAKIIDNQNIDDVSQDYGWYMDYINEVIDRTGIMDVTNSSFIHLTKAPHHDDNGVVDYVIIQFDILPIFGVTPENISRLGLYDAKNIGDYRDEDAAALLYDELKNQNKMKKKELKNAKNDGITE